jgi:hypothetical protein
MEKREGRRIKRRLTCEFFHDASSHRGIILDLSPSGVFIRTNAVLTPGTEIDIFLAASVAAPAMTLRGVVVRRRSVPATLTTVIQPGLGVKLLDAPREYGLLTSDCELEEAIETSYAPAQNAGGSPQTQPQPPPRAQNRAPEAGERASQEPPLAGHSEPVRSAAETAKKQPSAARSAAKKSPKREPAPSPPVYEPKPPRPPSAVLVGGPVLDEIAEILRDMEIETIECGPYDPQLAALDDARLLVVSAEVAMSDPIPVDTDMLVGIAVCGDISETMRSQIRQQGFRYLLRPHVHPEALRLLLRYAVYAERDRRGKVRYPVGCEVSVRAGWKRSRGQLLDISRGGCCLLVEHPPDVGSKITIKIPAEVVGGHAVKLQGKVLRTTPRSTLGGIDRTSLGVILDDLSPAARKALVDLCEQWSESPPMLPIGERWQTSAPVGNVRAKGNTAEKPRTNDAQARTKEASATEAKDSTTMGSETPPPFSVERQTRRGVFEQEIVQVDEEARVVQALLGRDLSIHGIRVVRQPGLSPGNKLRIALFDAAQKKPLILNSEVTRDDGGSGLFLRFIDPAPESTAAIEAMISRLPAVESIDPDGDARVVPASVISNRA